MVRLAAVGAAIVGLAGCATVAQLVRVQPPRFVAAEGRASELRLFGPSLDRPLGGAAIRIWSRVENPNPFGLTLTSLAGDVLLEDARAATIELPLGLPLQAGQDTVIPIEVSIDFSDLPELAGAAVRFVRTGAVPYRLEGGFAVDAGPFGQPRFGPMTLMSGSLDVRR
ncbi:MAG TPA: LEA type 2 family protein [Longimicrobiales bacterium]